MIVLIRRDPYWTLEERGPHSGEESTMTLQDFYQTIGGNYDEVMRRLTKEERIRKFVIRFLEDDSFDKLCEAKEKGDDLEVFHAVHTLKGISLNLGFKGLYEACSEMTDAVRGGIKLQNEALYEAVCNKYHKTVINIKQLSEA